LQYLVQRLDLKSIQEIKGTVPHNFVIEDHWIKQEWYSLDRINSFLLQEKGFAINIPDEDFIEQTNRYVLRGTLVLDNIPINLTENKDKLIQRDILNVIAFYGYASRNEILWGIRYLEFRRRRDKIKTKQFRGSVMGKSFYRSITRELANLERLKSIAKEYPKEAKEYPVYSLRKPISTMAEIKYLKALENPYTQKAQILSCLVVSGLVSDDYIKQAEVLNTQESKKLFGSLKTSTRYLRKKGLLDRNKGEKC
jgi:hypothetical protein